MNKDIYLFLRSYFDQLDLKNKLLKLFIKYICIVFYLCCNYYKKQLTYVFNVITLIGSNKKIFNTCLKYFITCSNYHKQNSLLFFNLVTLFNFCFLFLVVLGFALPDFGTKQVGTTLSSFFLCKNK